MKFDRQSKISYSPLTSKFVYAKQTLGFSFSSIVLLGAQGCSQGLCLYRNRAIFDKP